MSSVTDQSATYASVALAAIDKRLKDLHTIMPGIIVDFDPVTQLATVQPAIKRLFKTINGNTTFTVPSDLPKLINVPVAFPRGGGYTITLPVSAGDECEIRFCERSIDNWNDKGGIQLPGAYRQHSLSDAIATVGLSSQPNKIDDFQTDSIVIKKDDGTSTITISDGNIEIKTTTTVIVDSPTTEITGNVNVTGDLTCNDVTTSVISSINSHGHVGSPTSPSGPISNTGGPAP